MLSPPNPGKGLTFWMATALVVGNMIGSGIFLLPSALAPNGGVGVPGWLDTAVGAMVLAPFGDAASTIFRRGASPVVAIGAPAPIERGL